MVNRADRDHLARGLRALATGRITNGEFQDAYVQRSADPAIAAVLDAAWRLYDDLREYRLEGRNALTRDARRMVARCLLFLKSDVPYAWPSGPALVDLLLLPLNLVTLGAVGTLRRRRFARHGDVSAWPFLRRSDLNAAASACPRTAG
jgi:hypothetical protein